MTVTARTFTVTLPNGTTASRKSKDGVYTHAIVAQEYDSCEQWAAEAAQGKPLSDYSKNYLTRRSEGSTIVLGWASTAVLAHKRRASEATIRSYRKGDVCHRRGRRVNGTGPTIYRTVTVIPVTAVKEHKARGVAAQG